MAKQKENINEKPSKIFMDGFKSLCTTRHPYSVWSDFWQISALTIMNPLTKVGYQSDEKLKKVWEDRENNYLQLIGKYSKEEVESITEMFAAVVIEFSKKPYQDFAGQLYMQLGISNSDAGQFFTPYHLCYAMAKMTQDHEHLRQLVKEHGWYTMYDCACGGGATMIAGCEIANEEFHRLNYRNHVLIVANDIDLTCCCMCYVQLSLIGVAAIVTCSNALMQEDVNFYEEPEKVWFTPEYFSNVWSERRFFHGLDLNMHHNPNCGLGALFNSPNSSTTSNTDDDGSLDNWDEWDGEE